MDLGYLMKVGPDFKLKTTIFNEFLRISMILHDFAVAAAAADGGKGGGGGRGALRALSQADWQSLAQHCH